MAHIQASQPAKAILIELARESGVTPETFLNALLNYATSIFVRPGSWEANVPFEPSNYFRRDGQELSGCADTWFSPEFKLTRDSYIIKRIRGEVA